jgi:hypothetical protein
MPDAAERAKPIVANRGRWFKPAAPIGGEALRLLCLPRGHPRGAAEAATINRVKRAATEEERWLETESAAVA